MKEIRVLPVLYDGPYFEVYTRKTVYFADGDGFEVSRTMWVVPGEDFNAAMNRVMDVLEEERGKRMLAGEITHMDVFVYSPDDDRWV